MLYTRRDVGRIAVASLPLSYALAAPNSKFNGVQIGAITYSLRTMTDIDQILKALVDSGLSETELMSNHAEAAVGAPAPAGRGGGGGGGQGRGQGRGPGRGPDSATKGAPATAAAPGAPGAAPGGQGRGAGGGGRAQTPRPPMTEEQIAQARERAKPMLEWRKSVSMDKYKDLRTKFKNAGVDIQVLCFNMSEAITDDEIEYAFNMAKALGCKAISTTTQVTVSKRVAPFAEKHKMMVGYHGHDATWDPNEFATPQSFETAMSYSKHNGINLDIGHFTAGNYDPVPYIKEHHARITNLHLKDRKKDHGPNVPWGQGDTPIKAVLQLLKKEKYQIPSNIELEYPVPEGSNIVTEMQKCVQYCKEALA
jgi:sugar phosphate isomerase/epimerase